MSESVNFFFNYESEDILVQRLREALGVEFFDTSSNNEFSGEFYFLSNLFLIYENDVDLAGCGVSQEEYSFLIALEQPKLNGRNGFSLLCSIIVKVLIEDMLVDELLIDDGQSSIITIVSDEEILINKDDQTTLKFKELPQIIELAVFKGRCPSDR